MPRLRQMGRLLHIHRVFARHDLEEFIGAPHVFGPYRWLLRLFLWQPLRGASKPRALRLREALQDLGPVFVKFGQMLSTRPDLLPEDIALELSQLQDRVPPFPGVQAIAVIEQAYEGKLNAFFRHFDPVPVASASVAQVHFAELLDGTPVAVKVLRPDIRPVIERDLELLYSIARLALRYSSEAQRLRPLEVVEEYSKTLYAEIDLMREAANASQLRANFADSDLLLVPKVYWDLTRSQVMVMERVSGIPIGNIRALQEAGIDMRRLAHAGVEIFFTQAFRDGFFHADMHPGNIFVSPAGQYIAVDFGIMGSLSDRDKSYLAENFLAFFNRDYRGVAEAHVQAGWVANDTRLDEFEAAIRTVCEPIFARPLKDISFGRLLLRLFQTARRFNMEVQPQLVLLQKTLFNIEGLGRQLYPDLDLWVTAKPLLEEWVQREIGPRALLRSLRQEIPKWSRTLPELPMLLHTLLRKGGSGELSFHWKSTDFEKFRLEMRANYRRLIYAVFGIGLVLSAAVLLAVGGATSGWLGVPLGSWLCAGAGIAFLMMAWPANNIP